MDTFATNNKTTHQNDSPKYQGQQHSQQTRLTIYVSAITGNQNQKHIFQTIRDVHGRKASNTKEILDIAHGYLSNLFNKSPHNRQQITSYLEDFTPNISEQIATLDQPITLDELTKELKAKSNLSAPGEDGTAFALSNQFGKHVGHF